MAAIQSYPLGTPKSSDLVVGTSIPLPDTNDTPITKSFSAGSLAALALDYKAYVFVFSQSGTSNPVVTELENNTGLTFTFTRSAAGDYHLVPSASFDLSKTWAQVTGGNTGSNTYLNIKNYETDLIAILNIESTTGNSIDDVTTGFVEIRIYN